MRKFFMSAAIAFAAFPAVASAEAGQVGQFRHEGVAYSYRVTEAGEKQLIKGTANNQPFTLQVKDNRVAGIIGGRLVSFKLSEVQPVVGIVEIASR